MDNIEIHINDSEKQEIMEMEGGPPKELDSKKRPIEEISTDPTPSTSGAMNELKAKLAKVEKEATLALHAKLTEAKRRHDDALRAQEIERIRYGKELEDLIDLRVKLKTSKLAFGIEPEKYLVRDLKQAAVYLGEFILPKIKSIVDLNQPKFEALFLMGESFEHLPVKTCTLYNQNRDCREEHFHKDTTNMTRSHCCTVCWETLWVLAPHRVVTCPLTTKGFWEKMEINTD